jgi:hypothetical protein
MREELHERLENLTLDVEDVLNASEQTEEQGETFETDELCVPILTLNDILVHRTNLLQFQAQVQELRRPIRDA